MKVLLLCGVFEKEHEREVMKHSRGGVDFSANIFQQKLITGFREAGCDYTVLSAPFIGAYPMGTDTAVFRGFSEPGEGYSYVSFHNLWGIRNFSRAASLKKALESFVAHEDPQKLIVVYCPHTPFLEAAVYAKKKDPRIKICLYVPDLPQYMNLNAHRTRVYDIAKKYDVTAMMKLMDHVDSFVLLTEPMKDLLPVGDKPYLVIEGIVTKNQIDAARKRIQEVQENGLKYIVYAGKLNEQFGMKNLVDAFCAIEDPACRLVLCGRGDCEDYIRTWGRKDSRIMYLGQVSPEEAENWMRKANVVVNPRMGSMEYTKYSFPSKNIKYLLSGRPVVAYFLPGMPPVYKKFMTTIEREGTEGLREAIINAVNGRDTSAEAIDYLAQTCEASGICRRILEMTEKLYG